MTKKIISKLAQNLKNDITDLNKAELKKLIKECSGLTDSNCWWVEYRLKDAVKSIAENELIDYK